MTLAVDLPDPDWTSHAVVAEGPEVRVRATYGPAPRSCPHCGASDPRPHGTRRQTLRDVPIPGARVVIDLARARYRCSACGRTCLQPVAGACERLRMTRRLVRLVEDRCLVETFAAVASATGVPESTARKLAAAHAAQLDALDRLAPRRLGVYVRALASRRRVVLLDLEASRILDVLASASRRDVERWASSVILRVGVETITMDPALPCGPVIAAAFPRARRVDWCADSRGVREAADAAAERIDAAGRRYSFRALRHRLIRSPAVLRRLAASATR